MNRLCQLSRYLAVFVAGHFLIFPLPAENSTNVPPRAKLFSASTNFPPPLPPSHSPVDFFRRLLAMSPEDRENFLTNRPPEVRKRILVKVNEYEALNPDERELRLRATELRWYLMPLLRESLANRAARLARVPDGVRPLVEDRLEEWQILPPPLQQEFLDNEHILRYFAHVDATNSLAEETSREPDEAERAHWNSLSEGERRQIAAGFNQFFALTPDEKQKTLNTLSDAERAQMEKTLQSFDKLPPGQRAECVGAFAKFASMSAREQSEFLENAERWSQMSPAERQAWRDLVINVPQWPPLPIGFVPPSLPPETQPHASLTATNPN